MGFIKSFLLFLAAVGAAFGEFKVVGYAPSWSINVSTIKYDLYTHINYAFVLPSDGNGGLGSVPSASKLNSIVTGAHAKGVKVCISIGGWNNGDDKNFEAMAANADARAAFTGNVMKMVRQYNLDGADIDWEYPDPGVSGTNNTALMQLLADSLHAAGKLLTAAVISSGGTGGGWTAAALATVDFLNLMAYDGGSHSLMSQAEGSLTYWLGRGLPQAKAILGVPFYGRGGTGSGSFKDLVAADPANAFRDEYLGHKYNGIPTMKLKAALAVKKGGGIMFWEMSQDTQDPKTSLLYAIHQTMDSLIGPSALGRPLVRGGLDIRSATGGSIRYVLPEAGLVSLSAVSLDGGTVQLFQGVEGAGSHSRMLPARPILSGVYLLTVRQNGRSAVRRAVF